MLDAAQLEVMRQALTAIPEEMGVVLVRSAYSPNIKERRDASCALFDPRGRMVAQAEHIPVHLGSMPMAVESLLEKGDEIGPGDAWIVNDPYTGGSHLNDVTVISAVHASGDLLGFAVNKAHHADVGGSAPGSMPAAATSLEEEGLVLHLQRLTRGGKWVGDARERLLEASRTPVERRGDLGAQVSANFTGGRGLQAFVSKHGAERWQGFCDQVVEYSRRRMLAAIGSLAPGTYRSEGTIEAPGTVPDLPGILVPDMGDVRIVVEVTVSPEGVVFDLSGTDGQVNAPWNAPYSVTLSAVYFALRAMTDPGIPPNHGCYVPVEVICPRGSLLNPEGGRVPGGLRAGDEGGARRRLPGDYEQRAHRGDGGALLQLLRDPGRWRGRLAVEGGDVRGAHPHDQHREHARGGAGGQLPLEGLGAPPRRIARGRGPMAGGRRHRKGAVGARGGGDPHPAHRRPGPSTDRGRGRGRWYPRQEPPGPGRSRAPVALQMHLAAGGGGHAAHRDAIGCGLGRA